ncbi:MAG TPA: isoleucine--tRNA ligase [Cytophagaceae bacterium]|nr:isoleucine--tRNA ligase [Cytophagaceae bacterium]
MSKKYQEYKGLDLPGVGKSVLEYWEKNAIFEQSITTREGKESFTFYEGPPSANGTPGIHHVMARTVKDIFCRYKTLKGFQVKRKGGWDTHGLPVELQVEKELGITKEDIGKKISVEEYNQKCRETVMRFKSEWDDLTVKMGYWVDLDNPYITFENNYIESCWYLLKELYKKNLLYKGYTIQPYSPAAGTGLSSHELNQPGTYRDVRDTTVVAQFEVKRTTESEWLFQENYGKLFILAWTTTPWTLSSNSALAVGEKITYVKIRTFNAYTFEECTVILAKDLVNKYFITPKQNLPIISGKQDIEKILKDEKAPGKNILIAVLDEFSGSKIIGIEYEQLLKYKEVDSPKNAFRVIPGDFVSTEDGTGIVHIAPTFGADDYRVAKLAGVPAIMVKDEGGNEVPLVDKRGRFVKEVMDKDFGFGGEYVKEDYLNDTEKAAELAKQQQTLISKGIVSKLDKYMSVDERIALKLKLENKAFKVEKYEHTYPHCWRTDKPILYYPLDSWFIKTTAKKERLAELNKTINWKPASTGTGRFGNWLENLVDWNLSRSRYWGTPLPIWRTEDGTEEKCIGSQEELKNEIEKANKTLDNSKFKTQNSKLEDLHRPYVDNIVLVSDSGKPMFRETDLIDVWFDSGAMPYAQWHYPFENKEIFRKSYPADFISEGVDQTRGWFFTLHAIAGMLFDSVAFKNVVSTGLVLDKNGEKMSKRKGNVINPFDTLDKYGPDATRWYMISNAPPWDNLKFNLDGVTEVQRRFFGTLYNTYAFFALYANLDNFCFAEAEVPLRKRTESDRWVISKLNSLIKLVDESYADYEPTKAARAIEDFVCDDLSNWYVRLNRKRFWKGEYNEDKIAAYQTLYSCLETVAKLSSPIAPFLTEQLFLDLNSTSGKEKVASIHLSDFPKVDTSVIDSDLEEKMNLAQKISSLIHSLRKAHSIKVRQPLSKVLIPVMNEKVRIQIQDVEDLILSEVNVKKIEYIDDTSDVLVKKIKPNFKKLGKEFGAKLKEVGAIITAFTKEDIRTFEKDKTYKVTLSDGTNAVLTLEDVEISSEDIPGWLVASEDGLTVALDIHIDEELKKEGIARDMVNRVQNLRKDMGLDVMDKIKITVQKKNELIDAALTANKEYICSETQALSLTLAEVIQDGKTVEMDEFELLLNIVVS